MEFWGEGACFARDEEEEEEKEEEEEAGCSLYLGQPRLEPRFCNEAQHMMTTSKLLGSRQRQGRTIGSKCAYKCRFHIFYANCHGKFVKSAWDPRRQVG